MIYFYLENYYILIIFDENGGFNINTIANYQFRRFPIEISIDSVNLSLLQTYIKRRNE
jgi:hypothetical protein